MREQSGSHFDPSVMSEFEGLAKYMHERTHGISEHDAKKLLEPLIQKYFSVDLIDQE
jgi:hypothetical protein